MEGGPTSTVRRRRRKRKGTKTSSTDPAANSSGSTNANDAAASSLNSMDVDLAVAAVAHTATSGGVDSVLRKLRESVGGGDLYTALQVYKALFARFAKQGDVEPATELAAKGSCLLLKQGLTRAATDLALQLVELFTESHTQATETNTAHLLAIVRAYPTHPEATTPQGAVDDTCDEDAQRLLRLAVKWSSAEGPFPRGDPRLNYEAACAYRRTGDASNACQRYMFSEQCEEYAQYLHELASTKGYRGELDIFLARAVFQLLAVENIRDAIQVRAAFMLQCGGKKTLDTPLMNCVELLLDVVQRGKPALPLFQLLQDRKSTRLNSSHRTRSRMPSSA
jgi:hypothetical protein